MHWPGPLDQGCPRACGGKGVTSSSLLVPPQLPQHPFMWDLVPLLPLGCWPWKQAHSPQAPAAQCLWLSRLGHLCAPVPGDSEHWDLVPAHRIQVIIQGQQDLRRKVQARFSSCWPGRSSFQTLRPCLYGRYSQIHESLVTASAPQLLQQLCDSQPQRELEARRHWERNKVKEKA